MQATPIHAPLEVSSAIELRDLVGSENVPVLVRFWAPSTGRRRLISPELEKASERMEGDVRVVEVNLEDDLKLARVYGVDMAPTLALFVDGVEHARIAGDRNARDIVAFVRAALGTTTAA